MLSSDSDLFVAIGSDALTVTTLPRAFPDLDPGMSPSSCRSGSIASHTRGDRKGRPNEHAGRANPWEHYRGGCRTSHTFETGVFEMEVVEFHHTAWQHTQAATARIGLSCGVREELGRSSYSWAYGSSTGTIYYGGKLQQKDREAYRPGDTVAVAYKRPPCQQISKPKEVPGSCQQLCAPVGSVGFVCLRHLSCVPSS